VVLAVSMVLILDCLHHVQPLRQQIILIVDLGTVIMANMYKQIAMLITLGLVLTGVLAAIYPQHAFAHGSGGNGLSIPCLEPLCYFFATFGTVSSICHKHPILYNESHLTNKHPILYNLRSQNYCVCFVRMVDSTGISAAINNLDNITRHYTIFINTMSNLTMSFGAKIVKNITAVMQWYC